MIKILLSSILIFLLTACSTTTFLTSPTMIDRSDSIIVIDAGHGGHDSGAQCNGEQEKDIVLQITDRVRNAFESEGYNVHMTRSHDEFLTLGERTRIADKLNAKVFISIHANAIAKSKRSRFEEVEGIETYFLQKTRDAKSQRIAARENASVLEGTDSLSKKVIIDAVLNGPKIIESNKLAIDVQREMVNRVRAGYKDVKNGGVRPAPFYVLVGASRPSVLVEVGYVTNSKERERLLSSNYQEYIAQGIVAGTTRYIDNRKKELGF